MDKLLDIQYWLSLKDKALKRPNMDNGFIEEPPKPEDWAVELGSTARKEYLPTKDWKPYRSAGERQRRDNSSETMACVTYSTHNAMEEKMNLMKTQVENGSADYETIELVKIFKYFGLYNEKGEADLSDPYTAKLSGTSYRGNSFRRVLDSVRHNGVVAESVWQTPDTYSWNEYYKTIPQEVINKGKKWNEYVDFIYEWVDKSDFNRIKVYSPVVTSVYAGYDWNNTNIKIHKKTGNRHNHAVDNDYFKQNEYDGIFDSYVPFDKKVEWNYGLGAGRVIDFKLKKELKEFNIEEIQKVRKERGWEYIVLVRDFSEKYTQGIWKLTDAGLEKQTSVDTTKEWVMAKKKNGEIEGVPPDWFSKLIT